MRKHCKFILPLLCRIISAIFFKIEGKIRFYQNLHSRYAQNNNLHFCAVFCANGFCEGFGAIN